MDTSSLFFICIVVLIGVFILLIFLAGVIQLINVFFPEKKDDFELLAALTTTMNKTYPGTKITKIEVVK